MSEPTQTWDPDRYARTARFVSELGAPLLELLAPKAGERILDLGCGDGDLTLKLVEAGCRVVAVDASAAQVDAARARGLDARVADGEKLDFAGGFEGVFSNAALHWMRDPDAVIAGVWRALEPGGRFVGEFGGAGNVSLIVAALEAALTARGLDGAAANPWYFPTPEAYSERLAARGFKVASIALIPRPTPLPGPMADWLQTFAENFLNQVPPGEQPALLAEVSETLAPDLRDAEGVWSADYVRLRFAAVKPA